MSSFVALCICGPVLADDVIYPADAAVDITKPPYNATPDDDTDDTLAFQQALADTKRLIYVPNGTYIISDRLDWGGRQTRQNLQGQSEANTILKLKDGAPGYNNPSNPKAVIWTGSAPAQRFRNGIRNLTIDTGRRNPGAIGVQYMSNNQGAMRNVTIRSGDEFGLIGLDLGYSNEQGPCLINGITVRGFDVGISMKHAVNSVTLEDITLQGQHKYGILNAGQCVSLRGLKSENAVPAYWNARGSSLTALIDAELTGTDGAANQPAIVNEAGLFARNIKTTGYSTAIRNSSGTRQDAESPSVDEFVSHPPLSVFPSPPRSLNIQTPSFPRVPMHPLEEWKSVTDFEPAKLQITRKDGKKVEYTDWAPALQQAVDSGAKTVYFPGNRTYGFYSDVVVRGAVERIIGMEADMGKHGEGLPMQITVEGDDRPLVIEYADFIYAGIQIVHKGKRPLLLKGIAFEKVSVEPGAGPVFLDDVVGDMIRLSEGTHVYGRQVNLEKFKHDDNQPMVLNDGGTLCILGLKTENDPDIVWSKNRSRTEVLGGLIYANKNHRQTADKDWFVIDGASSVSFTLGEWVIRKQPFTPVVETRGDETRKLNFGDAYGRGEGSLVPLFVGYQLPADKKPQAPQGLRCEPDGTNAITFSLTGQDESADGLILRVSNQSKRVAEQLLSIDQRGGRLQRGVRAGQTYDVEVIAFNGAGESAPARASVTIPSQSPAGTGTGLAATYWQGRDFNKLAAERVDAAVDLDLKGGRPSIDGISENDFSVRWVGEIEPRFSESHTFQLDVDDGARMWVGDELVIDKWQGGRTVVGSIDLVAARRYPVRIDYVERDGDAKCRLFWSSPNQPKEIVPTAQLYPASLQRITLTAASESAQLDEGSETTLVFHRTGDHATSLSVPLIADGSAVVGIDYDLSSGELHFQPGEAQSQVKVKAIANDTPEPVRTLGIAPAPSHAYFTSAATMRLVLNDDDMPAAGQGTGLRGEYFTRPDLTGPVAERVDSVIDFGWDKREPIKGVNPDGKPKGYSIRWTGQLEPLFSEIYTLSADITKYGGIRVLIDGKAVIDAWDKGQVSVGRIAFEAGKRYDVVVEFSNRNFYGSYVRLRWSSPSQYDQRIPATQLYPDASSSGGK